MAYTLGLEAMTAWDPRLKEVDLIFVAHTHPTKHDLPKSTVSWKTTMPSPQDTRGFMPNQQYSIIMHRDVKDNQTPCAFIYDRAGNVHATRYKGKSVYQDVANKYISLEKAAKKKASRVGSY